MSNHRLKMLAIQLAAQLPDNSSDARRVMKHLKRLAKNWIYSDLGLRPRLPREACDPKTCAASTKEATSRSGSPDSSPK
jgi:uncharacterized protein YecE (DUF72 family)